MEQALNTSDPLLASSSYGNSLMRWKKLTLILLERIKQLVDNTNRILVERDKMKENSTLSLEQLFSKLSQTTKLFQSEVDTFWRDCSKYKLKAEWFAMKQEKCDFVVTVSGKIDKLKELKISLSAMADEAKQQQNISEAKKEQITDSAQDLVRLTREIMDIEKGQYFEQILNSFMNINPHMLDSYQSEQKVWRNLSEELLGVFNSPQSDRAARIADISKQMHDSLAH